MAAVATDLRPPAGSSALVAKVGSMTLLSEVETQFLETMQNNVANFAPGEDFVMDGEDFKATFIVRNGWAVRYIMLPDGRRQILSFVLPGDIIGLHINFRRKATYSAAALTDLELSVVDPLRTIEISQKHPVLATALSWTTAREFAILGDHAVRLGRLNAYERLCHLLVELFFRARIVGEAQDDGEGGWLDFPITQTIIADSLGLSLVHVNRQFRALRENGLIEVRSGSLRLLDVDRMIDEAEFSVDHLEEFTLD